MWAGIAVGADGHAAVVLYREIFADAEALVCFDHLLDGREETAGIEIEVHSWQDGNGAEAVLTLPQDGLALAGAQISLTLYGPGCWRVSYMKAIWADMTYQIWFSGEEPQAELMIISAHGGATVTSEEISRRPESACLSNILPMAAEAVAQSFSERTAKATALLEQAFPQVDWQTQELVKTEYSTEGPNYLVMAVVKRAAGYAFYAAQENEAGLVTCVSERLIPARVQADEIDLDWDGSDEGPEAKWNWLIAVQFSMDGGNFHVDFIPAADGYKPADLWWESDNEFWRGGADPSGFYVKIESTTHDGRVYLTDDPCFTELTSFDQELTMEKITQAIADHSAGEPPVIPQSEGEWGLPQPCAAELTKGTYAVYTGPGKEYYREANGKACVSTADWVQVFGREGDWALIQYRVHGDLLRFGYIQSDAFRGFERLPTLAFEYTMLSQDNRFVTGNPLGEGGDIYLSGQAFSMTRLGLLGQTWMYVELRLPDGSPARMFAEVEPSHG